MAIIRLLFVTPWQLPTVHYCRSRPTSKANIPRHIYYTSLPGPCIPAWRLYSCCWCRLWNRFPRFYSSWQLTFLCVYCYGWAFCYFYDPYTSSTHCRWEATSMYVTLSSDTIASVSSEEDLYNIHHPILDIDTCCFYVAHVFRNWISAGVPPCVCQGQWAAHSSSTSSCSSLPSPLETYSSPFGLQSRPLGSVSRRFWWPPTKWEGCHV